ncbi:MAG: ATP-binding cassette domain-containing protein [Candidatus Eisenbacteria bacterium]
MAAGMIAARGLVKRLGGRDVLAGVDLDVREGETLVLLGRSGSGKSVFLKHVIGLMRADAGRIELFGEDVTQADERTWNRLRRDVAMVFQAGALFDSMSVGENIALGLRHQTGAPEAEIQARVAECLGFVGLADTAGLKPSALSGGMRKRVGIARAIALRPRLLLYDEPTSGLDPVTSDVINRLVRALQKDLGVTSVVVTHDMQSAYHIADRIALLSQGRIRFTGTPDEVRVARDPVLRQFVEGTSQEPVA